MLQLLLLAVPHTEVNHTGTNEHGIAHRRGVTCQPVTPIPDLRSGLDSPTNSGGRPPFQGPKKKKKFL